MQKVKLVVIDLEDYYPEGERTLLDISPWLVEGIILVEKQFRETVNSFDWSIFENKYVALYCKTDAIIVPILGLCWLLLNSIK